MRASCLGHRAHLACWGFLLCRLSGLAQAVSLPLDFLKLGLAADAAALDSLLDWTRAPLVRASEIALAAALVVELVGGAQLLVQELWPW